MEDAHSAVLGLPDVSDNISWFAVFDGHAGSRVSAHCSGHLLDCILSQDSFKESLKKEHVLSEEELMDKVINYISDKMSKSLTDQNSLDHIVGNGFKAIIMKQLAVDHHGTFWSFTLLELQKETEKTQIFKHSSIFLSPL